MSQPVPRRTAQPGPRRYATGEASRDRILEAAEVVLARDGYQAFSTRRVAQECSISSGNLTYYFPTKDSLLEALMDAIYERYERRYADLKDAETPDSSGRLTGQLTAMLRDALDAEASGLFFELWVMARHNDFAADLIDRLYQRSTQAIAAAMADAYPDLSNAERLRAAYFLVTLADGVGSAFSQRGKRSVRANETISLAVEAVETLLERLAEDR